MLPHDQQCRCDKGKAGTQISRSFCLRNENKEQSAEAVHQQYNSRVDVKQSGNQHRCAEHSEHMLDAQGNGLPQRRPFIYLNNSFCHSFSSFLFFIPRKMPFRNKSPDSGYYKPKGELLSTNLFPHKRRFRHSANGAYPIIGEFLKGNIRVVIQISAYSTHQHLPIIPLIRRA